MHLTLLNGDPSPDSNFQVFLHNLTQRWTASGHTVNPLDLATLDLKGCSGCFGCWVKTPGGCIKRDDSARVCQAVLDSELTLLASPLRMGFTTSLLKRAADQMIPLLHPYFVVEGGEVHHRARYAKYPRFGLLLDAEGEFDAEDVEITAAMWGRMARNLKSKLAVTALSDRPAEEVADEIAAAA